MLSLISYNIFLGKHFEKIKEWYKSFSIPFDLVCFQEFPEKDVEEFVPYLGSIYNYKFAPTIINKRNSFGQLTIYNKEKLHLLGSRLIPHGTSIIDRIYTRNSAERSALLTEFEYKNTKFTLINCHLTPLTHNKRRLNEMKLILKQIREKDKVVLIGDYNYPLRRSSLLKFMEHNDFENPTPSSKTYKFFFIKLQNDYIFHRNCAVENVRILDIDLSDHSPLIAQIDPEHE